MMHWMPTAPPRTVAPPFGCATLVHGGQQLDGHQDHTPVISPVGLCAEPGRRFYGCEIKQEYITAARRNLDRAQAIVETDQKLLFA